MQKLSGIISVFIVCGILSFSHPDICFAAQDFPQDYTVKSVSALECFDAKVTVLEHDLTGAGVVLISNDDPNRYFMPVFNTPVSDDRGIPHVFEHSAMNGSKKYSSRNLYKALSSKGFVTFANAYTQDRCTAYPVASLSEKQLLKLADYYTDLCFEPLIMTDEDIFRSEAWSYSLADEKADITVGGTIYSEMMNTYSADRDAQRRAVRLLYPDSSAAHEAGGVPAGSHEPVSEGKGHVTRPGTGHIRQALGLERHETHAPVFHHRPLPAARTGGKNQGRGGNKDDAFHSVNIRITW